MNMGLKDFTHLEVSKKGSLQINFKEKLFDIENIDIKNFENLFRNEIKEYDETEEYDDIDIDIKNFRQIEELLQDDDDIKNLENFDNDDNDDIEKNLIMKKPLKTNKSQKTSKTRTKKLENKYKLVTRRIDANRIRHKKAKNIEVYTSILKNVKIESDGGPIRSGAIIYTHVKGKTYFCLGVDSAYGDLTDFAGGVKKEETVIEGGLRELEEETQGIFGKITTNEVKNCLAFFTTNMLIMFIRREVDIEETKNFFELKINKCGSFKTNGEFEVSDIIWLESDEFIQGILGKGRRIYSRVRKILSKVVEIIESL